MSETRHRVAVDANPAVRDVVTGTELYTRELCRRLPGAAPELEWTFFASRPANGLGFDVTVVPLRRLWSQVRLPIALGAQHADLLFVPAHSIPFAWTGRVLTVVHDLAFERYPEAYSRRERTLLQATTRWAVRRCPILIAVSEATKADLVAFYRVAPERVRVVPNGGGEPPPVVAAAPLDFEPFVLQVGRIERRKNQVAALAAVERLEGVRLVVAGFERDAELATSLRASPRCTVLGPVDRATLDRLYARAGAVVVPSLYEGFGLPVLEALARGRPVVAARNSSLPEVGGDAAQYVDDPDDAEALAAALESAMTDISAAVKGPERAGQFTWDRCALGVADVIREVLG
jgi:glycosyltransferase involved in cell wall biosynthesis